MWKLLAASAAVVAALGAGVVAAPAAHAGVSPSVILVGQTSVCVPSATSVTGNPGDSFRILVGPACTARVVNTDAPISPGSAALSPQTATPFTLGASGSGTFTLYTKLSSGSEITTVITVTVTGDPIPDPVFHDDLQQVGVPDSGDCADVSLEVGHYPGAPLGGWSKSWSQWINDGKGGPVCTRELEEMPDGTIVLIG